MLQWKNILAKSADIFIPKICFSCDKRIDSDNNYLCSECLKLVPVEKKVNCPYCGAFFDDFSYIDFSEKCFHCKEENLLFDKCCSPLIFNDVVRSLIHSFKYKEKVGIGNYLADVLIAFIEQHKPFNKIDLVCPVPLHPVKQRERGFNQSEILARRVAEHFGWEYNNKIIKRVRFTKSQTTLKGEERRENVRKAFSVDRITNFKVSDILIVDDVFTTGATVNSISEELKKHQIEKIYVLTVARPYSEQ